MLLCRRRPRRSHWRAYDQGNKIQRRLCQPDLDLKRLELAMRCAEAQEYRPVRETLANMFDIGVCQGIQYRAPWILPSWSYRSHVGWLTMVSLILQLIS
jgi:hypothetical protein